MQKILVTLGLVIHLCLALVLGAIGVVLLALPAIYDLLRFLTWKFSTKKFHKKWYRRALRKHVADEMHCFRYGWYDLYVSENAQSWTKTRGEIPAYGDLHLAKPGNKYWRAYVRQQMSSFKLQFAESKTGQTIGMAQGFASL